MWQRLRKYLRIAVTAVSLLVCVLLIVLWVRSYYSIDTIKNEVDWIDTFQFATFFGHLSVHGSRFPNSGSWTFSSRQHGDNPTILRNEPMWAYQSDTKGDITYPKLTIPLWLPLVLTGLVAAIPWIKWRFSLRTLLIVMTLFSLFFGAVAWSMRG